MQSQMQGIPVSSGFCFSVTTLPWFSTCELQPLGVEQNFHMWSLKTTGNTDIYVVIHNSSKITVTK